MTVYLLDANVFIQAKNTHYRFAVAPGFWQWILRAHTAEQVFSIPAIRDELYVGGDELSAWVRAHVPTTFFISAPATIGSSLASLARWTADHDLYSQTARETFLASADYALVAHAQALGMTVVTHEASRPGARNRVLIPQACEAVRVPWVSPFDMVETAGMRLDLTA
jgi:hypothetical protein